MIENLMTIGEVAKKGKVSVRTLQYYDKCQLLKPSAYSEGGYRLYSNKDLVRLFQIRGLKMLGLSLDEIKKHIGFFNIDRPETVLGILKGQKEKVEKNIKILHGTISAIELLESEIKKNNMVDFEKYAKITASLQGKVEYFWYVDMLGLELFEHIANQDEKQMEDFGKAYDNMVDTLVLAQEEGISPESERGQELAMRFWQMIESFADGDDEVLKNVFEVSDNMDNYEDEATKRWKQIEGFISEALDIYLRESQDYKGIFT
jgi:DNA-binding transcriptional MerR regulator